MAAKPALQVVRTRQDATPFRPIVRWGLFYSRLAPPVARETDVARQELVRLLADTPARVISVIAPAGYGKTTLLGQYADAEASPTAWLRIGADCNDPTNLARYLAAALGQVTAVPNELVRELDAVRPRATVVAAGLAAVVRETPRLCLVIDDADLVHEQGSIDLVDSLVVDAPEGAHLVLAARHQTSFHLASARARGELLELGVEQLRFGVADAGTLLRNAGLTSITPEDVASLTERTEGWAAGLYLAARSSSADPAIVAPGEFGGDDRFVADYLSETMLRDLPAHEVDFLLRSSELEDLSGPLCDAALETSGSAATLQALEASNLLVVPLDHRRERYRYHHLLRDMLRAELRRRSPELVAPINARASVWCEAEGSVDLAVAYAMAGGDADRVAELIGRHAQAAYYGGRASSVRAWFDWLGRHASIEGYPMVGVLGTWLMMLDGHPVEAERWADVTASQDGANLSDADVEGPRMLAAAFMCRDGIDRMLADALSASSIIGPQSPWRTAALAVTGLAFLAAGQPEEATVRFEEAAEVGAERGTAIGETLAHAEIATLALERGDVELASQLAADARRVIEEGKLGGYSMSVLVWGVSARLSLVQGDPVRARRCLDEAVPILPQLTYALPTLALQARAMLAKCAMGLGDASLAASLLDEADEVIRRRPRLGRLIDEVAALRELLVSLGTSGAGLPSLTPAEARLLPLLTTHLAFREIGEHLFISPHTVKTQAISIYRKLGVTSRAAAVETARRIGLLTG